MVNRTANNFEVYDLREQTLIKSFNLNIIDDNKIFIDNNIIYLIDKTNIIRIKD